MRHLIAVALMLIGTGASAAPTARPQKYAATYSFKDELANYFGCRRNVVSSDTEGDVAHVFCVCMVEELENSIPSTAKISAAEGKKLVEDNTKVCAKKLGATLEDPRKKAPSDDTISL